MQAAVRSHSGRAQVGNAVIYGVVAIFTFLCIVPFWYVLVSSFSQNGGFWIDEFTLDGYRYIFSTQTLPRSLINTTYITVLGTLLKLLVTSLMAYALAETSLPGRKLILNMVIFTMLFGGGMIPTYFVVRSTGLMNSLWSLVIPGLVSPFNLIVMKNFFQGIPQELRESARIDGCHEMTLLFRIILPLIMPTIAVLLLYYGVGHWNSWFPASIYLQDNNKLPIQNVLRAVLIANSNLLNSAAAENDQVNEFAEAIKYSAIVLTTVPVLCIYPFLQRYFVKGVMIGAVKG